MTYNDLNQVYLPALLAAKELPGDKFSYAIYRNINKVFAVLKKQGKKQKALADIYQKDYPDYMAEFAALQEKHVKKDKEGSPILDKDNRRQMDTEPYKKDIAVLKKKYKPLVDEIAELNKKNEELLNEKVEVDFYRVHKDDVSPEMTAQHWESLSWMIYEGNKIEVIS